MLRFIRPTLPSPEAWLPYLRASYEQRLFTNNGPAARRLEAALLAKYGTGDREAVLVSSCTSGLTAVLCALGIRGRVVVPAFTFPATAQAVLQGGCVPVFCDVCPDTGELRADTLDALLSDHPIAAVVHVRVFGFCRDLAPIERVASRHGVPLIVDAAAALGGRFETGDYVGGQGEAEVFSLHVTKVFGVGEGGLVFCRRSHAAPIRQACNFGLSGADVTQAGLNAKLSDFHAAIGLAVLDRIDGDVRRRQQVAERYARALARCSWARLPQGLGLPPMQTYPIVVESAVQAEAMVAGCLERGVELRRYYRPSLRRATAFLDFEGGSTDVADDLADRTVCLPIYSDMTDDEVDLVLNVLSSSVAK